MSFSLSTKMTKGGQTTVPKEIREALGIADESRVWWHLENGKATLAAEPSIPNEVRSPQEFWDGVNAALEDVRAGRTRDASSISDELRKKYGLA